MTEMQVTNPSDAEVQEKLKKKSIPEHIAIIMDGNGRWAKSKGLKRVLGHREGIKAVRDTAEACAELGVKYLTLYAFSTENWQRPKQEVDALMELLVLTTKKELSTLTKNKIKLGAIGDLEQLPPKVRKELSEGISQTENYEHMTLTLALSYGGRMEITQAVKRIARQIENNELSIEEITPECIASNLYTASMPDPDLMIRTGGDYRISNFLLWQLAYAELYTTPTFWPDFRRADLYTAITEFQQRERRFGKVLET